MNAKKYLMQVKIADIKIAQKLKELEDMKILATCSGGFDYSRERVQTSNEGDTLSSQIAKYIDFEKEINTDIDVFYDLKHRIIAEIHRLDDDRYIGILFKKYIEYKSLEVIAVEMNISYGYLRQLHGEALENFTRIVLKKEQSE